MARRLAFILAVVTAVCSQVWADDFSDFRIPTHNVYDAVGQLEGSYYPYEGTGIGYSNERATTRLSTELYGYWLRDSDRLRILLNANGSFLGTLSRFRQNENEAEWASQNESNADDVQEYWHWRGDARFYPWTVPVGLSVSGSATGAYFQRWSGSYSRTEQETGWSSDRRDEEYWNYYHGVSFEGMAGFGRVRDATDVYRVYIIESRLRRNGVLAGSLSPNTRRELASLIYIQSEYNRVHDRPLKSFWEEAERILRRDGAVTDTLLDAYDLYRIAEPEIGAWKDYVSDYYNEDPGIANLFAERSTTLRQVGHFVGVSFAADHTHQISRRWARQHQQSLYDTTWTESILRSWQRSESSSDAISLGPAAEYHRPFGPRWQFDAFAHVRFPTYKVEHGIESMMELSVAYLAADRWRISADLQHQREIDESEITGATRRFDDWSLSLQGDATYYIEDHLELTLSASHAQGVEVNQYTNSWSMTRLFHRSSGFQLGLAYHFLGGISLPGIVPQPRLLPWNQ